MGETGTPWRVEDLSPRHDSAGFACGHPSLDEFLRRYAGQNQKTGVSRTFVALKPAESIVHGYYSLSAGAVALDKVPEVQRRRLPRYPVPVAHLGRLAVDQKAQGQGLGEFLLIDALRRIQTAADAIGIHAIEVVSIDDAAKRFYLKYGFIELLDDPRHLYLSIRTVRRLGLF